MVGYLQFTISTRLGRIGYTFFPRLASAICFPAVWHGILNFSAFGAEKSLPMFYDTCILRKTVSTFKK